MSSLRLLFGTFIFLLSVSVFGQSFPVTAVVQSLPPFSNQISEWGDPLNSSLGVSLLLNDRNDGNYQVRLELTIEGNGVRLQTNNNWLPTPINLNYGQVVQLGGIELSEYLNLDHLSFTGYSRQAYVQNGGLPDGSYTICVRVFDYNRSQEEAASDRACTFVQASLLDPPVVLSPTGQQLPLNPQNLIIQWQARHTASFITDYRVEIYQVDPSANFTPEQIYSFQQPWVETQIDGLTTTVIDASFPQLETGYRYLLRVQARDPLGNNNFRNAGYSEPVFFDYGSDCPAPLNVSADVSNTEAARINWDYQEGIASSYVIRYRKKQDGANWYEEASIRNQVFLRELLEGTTYEVQVQSICSNVGGGLFGPLFEFTTPGIPVDDAVDCSAPIESLTLPTNKMLLQQDLTRGQEVTVGGFKMKIQSATKTQNGGWKGLGQVRVPWLFKTFNCRFHNLFINSDRVVFDGNVVAIDEGLSSLSGFMTVGEIFDAQDNSLRNFCGDTSPPRDTPSVVAYQSDDFYASGNPDYNNHYIPFDPTSTTGTGGVVVDDSQFYNEYNPNNSRARYTPSDYNNPNNPYTAEKPYDGSNIWNPWNAFNPYNYLDYDDPANPWSSNFIWTADRMFDKQGGVPAAVDESLLSGGVSCPVKLGNSPNMLAIYGIKFTPTGAFLNAYFSATIPSVNQHTAFQAIGVGFGPSGLQGETKLKMLSDLSFSWNDKMKLTINGGNGTYVRFDCEGVNQVAINMKVEVCRNVAIPVDPYTYERDASGYVTGTFAAVADGWGEFAGDISITPFELDSLPGWAFSVQNAVFDFSTTSTPSSVQFPSGYVYDGVTDSPDPALRTGLQNPQWRGFYLGGARIRIPNNLTGKKENEPPVTIGAQHLIIDQTGFSGTVFGTNILSIDTGRLDSWAIGIDTVALGIQQNQFKKLAIAGELIVPAVDANLTYNCHIQPGSRYAFSLALRDSSLTMNAFVAEVRLDPNTKISLEYIAAKDTFAASAELHGKITFKPSLGGGNNDQGADTSAGSAGAGGAFGGASDASGADFNNVSEPQDTVNSLKVPYIAFQNFKLSSRAPYLENLGEWAIASNDNSQSKVAGFPLTLNQVGLFQNEAQNEVAFGIDLTLNLVKSDDQGFGANGRAFVICDVNVDPVTRKQEWKFKRVRLDKLSINYQGPGFAFAGYLRNYETHPVYGTGFQGGIQASFTPGIRVAVAAMFGTKKNPTKQENYRYFFADALLALDPGITLGTSGMALYGFGGGVSYHMKRQGFGDNGLPYSEAESIPADTPIANDTLAVVGGASDLANAFISGTDPSSSVPDFLELPTELGETLSGVSYVPDQSVGIGIKAMVAIGAVRREVFNGDITFEIIFNTNGSLNYIGLMGNANIMTPPRTSLNPIPKPAVAFFFDMGYDFMNNSFSAYLRLQVAAPPGIAYIRGAYPNNVAGEGNIYFSKDDWYFYLGRPNTPIKLSYDVSKLANLARADGNGDAELPPDNSTPLTAADTVRSKPLGSIDVIGLILTAYIEAGTILDPFPSPPQRVLDILGDDSFGNAARRDDPAFANAGGLLFGASLKLNMPKLNFLIFYAELYGGVGFDMMLKDYGLNARCANDLNNSDPIGFNGWYATGQLYGYLDGKVGIDIAIGALKLKVKILEVGAAALIQARLPNPMWAKGAVAGRFTVLNGLIKGNCKFDFEVGQECEVVPTGDQSIRLVQSITPNGTAEESSVFARPQAIFNFEMNKGTVLLDETGQYMEFKPSLKSFRVTDSITGANIPGSLEWSEDKTIAAFIPSDILPPHRVYKVNIQSELYQRRSSGEPFRLIDEGGNIPPEQEDSAYFRTGTAPDHIPEENVAYAYPINLQANFLVEESDRGYVKLIQGQDYLFENIDPTEWNQQIRFQQDGAVVNAASYAYDALNNQLNFAIPANELARSVVSSFEIVDLPVGEDADLTSNVVAADAVLLSLDQGSLPDSADTEILLATQEANGALTSRKERIVYHLDFRTSHYDNFADKMAELKRDFIVMQDRALTDSIDANLDPIPYLKIKDFVEVLSGPEVFDRYELSGFQREGKDYAPLIRIRANPNVTANDWFNNRIRPNVYDNFPSPAGAPYNFNLSWRQEEPYGMPPVKAVFFRQNSLLPLPYLSNDNISSGAFITRKRPVLYRYHLPYQIYRDYADYWNQAGNYIRTLNGTDPDPGLESFMEWDFIYPPDGDYEMIIEYVLPGQTSPSSTYQHLIPNEID